MDQDTFYEITRRTIPVSKNDGHFLTWRDSVINVRTDKGMNFFEFSYNLECLDRYIDFVEFSIRSPKDSPAASICKSDFLYSEMPNYDYTEMILDSSFWPHNKMLTQEMANITIPMWSPRHFIEAKGVLAILNNIGGVEFFTQHQYFRWKSILNLSPILRECLEYNRKPNNFEELRKAAYVIETSSICWSPKLNDDNSCYFVTAQKNNVILFWQIYSKIQFYLMELRIKSNMNEIRNMLWIPKSETIFLLICADLLGQVNAFEIQIENGEFKLLKTHILWECKDRMVASHLHYTTINGHIIIFFSKHRHFVVQMLDQNCEILSQFINNINDFKIIDITSAKDGFYLAIINVKIYKINIKVADNTLCVDLIPINLKESYSTNELYSIGFSRNDMLCVLAMIDRKVLCRKEVFKIDLIFTTTEAKLDSLIPKLLDNPTKTLTNHWDFIEVLRYRINKTRLMPNVDFYALYLEASNDIYKLKMYMILLIFYLKMKRIARMSSNITLPETSIDLIKEKILLLHSQSTIHTLYNKHKNNEELNTMEQESFNGCVKYLKYYSKKYKTLVELDEETLSIVKTNFKYICQSCDDEILDGFTCQNGHINMFCMLSLTPIDSDDYLVCKCCSVTARIDLDVKNPVCVFCDQSLIKPD